MTVIPEGIDLIKRHEQCSLTAYQDPRGVWTVGWGCTGPNVSRETVLTQQEADDLFLERLKAFDEGVTLKCPESSPEQHAAMVCLAYNIGLGAFGKSSVARLHNAQRYSEAAQAFALWNKCAGKVLIELVRRRAEEAALYAKGTTIPEAVKIDLEPGLQAEGEKPLTQSKTIISTVTGGIGAAGATASAIQQNVATVKDTANTVQDTVHTGLSLLPFLQHYGVLIALGLVAVGLAGIAYAKWHDRNSGRI